MADRLARREEVEGLVQAWVAERDAAGALEVLERAEVPCALLNSVRDLFADPQVRARENIVAVPEPRLGTLSVPGVVPRLSRTPGEIRHLGARTPGADNEAIYLGRLGLAREEYEGLRARGII
jgi:formyl-CoA transferase